MTLKELLKHNAEVRRRKEEQQRVPEVQVIVKESEKEKDGSEDSLKKKGKKPANREYMVVEETAQSDVDPDTDF